MAATTPRAMNRWTKEEDKKLRQQVLKYRASNAPDQSIPWRKIAQLLPGRSNKDCRKRWCKIDDRWKRGPWQPDEERRLKDAVSEIGRAWVSVSAAVGTRSPDQCAKHWQNALDPSLTRRDWEESEVKIFCEAVSLHGHHWSKIQQQAFPGRSKLDLSNRLALILRRMGEPLIAVDSKHSVQADEKVERGDDPLLHPQGGAVSGLWQEGSFDAWNPLRGLDSNAFCSDIEDEFQSSNDLVGAQGCSTSEGNHSPWTPEITASFNIDPDMTGGYEESAAAATAASESQRLTEPNSDSVSRKVTIILEDVDVNAQNEIINHLLQSKIRTTIHVD
ncbi:hypothetical protein T310_3922 [Rasamsonia emersonii CBS 393.64]|uniref:Uncharacterized protein n=1 Tax=Rasamsonia emersonii (strain ATCC 16479 / CBS 393.64 / IMI 116815) TaxID=1408163 RepID=A0A0F4YUS2_RASE3|nr:hypothetical protein T310_3922 [Rasamsonia emersonii CBS 393.64]KKA22032.1 hypothetical protein T310_3922 [Rasamsonia emersonii CBS 393.64]